VAAGDEVLDDGRADEAGGPGDEYAHDDLSLLVDFTTAPLGPVTINLGD